MSVIAVSIPTETEVVLRSKAETQGVSLEEYVGRLAEMDANGPRVPLDEIARPVREAFKNSGLTDQELINLVEEVRGDIWKENHSGIRT